MRAQWQFWQDGLSKPQIENIKEIASHYDYSDAGIFADHHAPHTIRSTKIKWLTGHAPIQQMMWDYVLGANRAAFNVDIENICDIQYTEYHADTDDFYNWHHDIDWAADTPFDRKLSITILLSDPNEFEGGDFMFKEAPNQFEFKAGSVIVFPSYLTHSVQRVTKGTRKSLVAWFEGPRWR